MGRVAKELVITFHDSSKVFYLGDYGMKKLAVFTAAFWFSLAALAEHGGPPAPGQPLVIDVRNLGEYQRIHVREAVNIPYDKIGSRIAAFVPDQNARIVLYCRSGRRSGIAEQTLRELGYSQIVNGGGLDNMLLIGYQTN
jgi:phage shock protein E